MHALTWSYTFPLGPSMSDTDPIQVSRILEDCAHLKYKVSAKLANTIWISPTWEGHI